MNNKIHTEDTPNVQHQYASSEANAVTKQSSRQDLLGEQQVPMLGMNLTGTVAHEHHDSVKTDIIAIDTPDTLPQSTTSSQAITTPQITNQQTALPLDAAQDGDKTAMEKSTEPATNETSTLSATAPEPFPRKEVKEARTRKAGGKKEKTSQKPVSIQMAKDTQGTFQSSDGTMSATTTDEETSTLEDLEAIVRENDNLKTGEALCKIKEGGKFKAKEKKWGNYCRIVFKFSPQYANCQINSFQCFDEQRSQFEKENRASAIESLPHSVNFWKQVYRLRDAVKRHTALEGLLDSNNNLVLDWSKKWAEAVKGNKTKTEAIDGKANDASLRTLASQLLNAVSENADVVSAMIALNPQEQKNFFRILADQRGSSAKEADNEKA